KQRLVRIRDRHFSPLDQDDFGGGPPSSSHSWQRIPGPTQDATVLKWFPDRRGLAAAPRWRVRRCALGVPIRQIIASSGYARDRQVVQRPATFGPGPSARTDRARAAKKAPLPRLGPELASSTTTSPRERTMSGQPRTTMPS